MRRLDLFLIVLTIAVSVLVTLAVVSWYLAATSPLYYGSSWMGQMWGEMGGNGAPGGMMGEGGGYYGGQAATTPYLWVIPVALIAIVVIAIAGVAFYLAYPELKYIRGAPCNPQKPETPPTVSNSTDNSIPLKAATPTATKSVSASPKNCDLLLKTMTPEEKKVLNVLINHKRKYLQKYVVKEAELSRLKTHRIVARFAQRGIVTVKEFGNTNEVSLTDWITIPTD